MPLQIQLPAMHPTTKAAMREYLSRYRTDVGAGDTDLDFEGWLRSTAPDIYQKYRTMESAAGAEDK